MMKIHILKCHYPLLCNYVNYKTENLIMRYIFSNKGKIYLNIIFNELHNSVRVWIPFLITKAENMLYIVDIFFIN